MSLPVPAPGLVIWYDYVWHGDHSRGISQGSKDRPCAVVLVLRNEPLPLVMVLTVTHSRPSAEDGMELPPAAKSRLGLDGERSWVIVSEANVFSWPGPDLRPSIPGDASSVAIGWLPEAMLLELRRRYRERAAARAIRIVRRKEE